MKVLIAIDDSDCSAAAVDCVADRSWPQATEFHVMTVMEPLIAQYGFAGAYAVNSMVEAERELGGHLQQLVDGKVSQLKAIFGKDTVTGKVLEGSIADSIIDAAKEWDADLIVVGSHGRRGFQRFLLGSVAEKVASHAPCSIEIVKEKIAHEQMHTGDAEKGVVLKAQR